MLAYSYSRLCTRRAVATATSTGYGDVVPTTLSRRLFAGVVMVIGQLLFGLLLAIIAAILVSWTTHRTLAG